MDGHVPDAAQDEVGGVGIAVQVYGPGGRGDQHFRDLLLSEPDCVQQGFAIGHVVAGTDAAGDPGIYHVGGAEACVWSGHLAESAS